MITGNEPIYYFEYETANEVGGSITAVNLGLTIRQHFAAMAMQGILSSSTITDLNNLSSSKGKDYAALISEIACDNAEALIKELNKLSSL